MLNRSMRNHGTSAALAFHPCLPGRVVFGPVPRSQHQATGLRYNDVMMLLANLDITYLYC